MIFCDSFNFLVVLSVSLFNYNNAIRTKDKMYEPVTAAEACYRRLNATHQIGCSSQRGGSTGAIHYCDSQSDLDFILKDGTAPPYIPILPTDLLTPDNVNKLKSSNKVSGLLIYPPSERSVGFYSHENKCPNPESSLKDTCGGNNGKPTWNPHGTGLLYQDIPFPIFYVEVEDNLKFARECFIKHNNHSFDTQRDRSLCSLQLVSFMYATTNSQTCIRRSNTVTNLNPVKFCDPLGDQNIFSTLFPLVSGENLTEPIRDFKFIVLAARLDSTSMFEKTAGATSPITGLVTLLATAKLLKSILPTAVAGKKLNVLFVVFNGETYDYIGSQRLLYDMNKGVFPVENHNVLPKITVDNIHLFIELNQLNLNVNGSIYAHYLENNKPPPDFMLALAQYAQGENLNLGESPDSLPPASYHTFLKNDSTIQGLVLTDHDREYTNHFYNSLYDNATNLKYTYLNITREDENKFDSDNIQGRVGKISVALTKTLYRELTGTSYNQDLKGDIQLIDELFHCYLENSNCRVHKAVQKHKLGNQPLNLYVGVEIVANFATKLVGLTLAWLTGDVVGAGNVNCTNHNPAWQHMNFSKSLDDLDELVCCRTTMNFSEAISPAFVIDDYDWSSGEYSTWTESTWGDIRIRLFLKPSAAHENMTIAVGSIVFIFSLLFVYFVKSRADVLFAPPLPTLAPTSC